VVSSQILSQLDTRDIRAGETPYPIFRVLLRHTKTGELTSVPLGQYADYLSNHSEYHLQLPEGDGEYWYEDNNDPGAEFFIHYQVSFDENGHPIVKCQYSDMDYPAWWQYRVMGDQVEPIYSGMFHMGHALSGVIPGFAIASIIYWIAGRIRKTKRESTSGEPK
jgi:hypothetical protein